MNALSIKRAARSVLGGLRVPARDELDRHDGTTVHCPALCETFGRHLLQHRELGKRPDHLPIEIETVHEVLSVNIDEVAAFIGVGQQALGHGIARLGPLFQVLEGLYPVYFCGAAVAGAGYGSIGAYIGSSGQLDRSEAIWPPAGLVWNS
ncbi:hypothetical protein ACIGHF_15905 [Stenotrophomonas sp. NPDC077464]|uniref:hypothetical protein n=1 Tax=unclassified Stenotrophomonas TaxID=196198 RepID=UPI0037D09D97